MNGYFGIGIYQTKNVLNVGTLWRSADLMGAAFIFTIGGRYKRQASDTYNSSKHIPLYNYETFEDFTKALPYNSMLVGIELHPDSVPIKEFGHYPRAVYLLGAEDHGLPEKVINKCNKIIQLPGERSMNVAVAGSIVMFDRTQKLN